MSDHRIPIRRALVSVFDRTSYASAASRKRSSASGCSETSGWSSRNRSNASSPFPASPTTSIPDSVPMNALSPARMSGWSSTASTRIVEERAIRG